MRKQREGGENALHLSCKTPEKLRNIPAFSCFYHVILTLNTTIDRNKSSRPYTTSVSFTIKRKKNKYLVLPVESPCVWNKITLPFQLFQSQHRGCSLQRFSFLGPLIDRRRVFDAKLRLRGLRLRHPPHGSVDQLRALEDRHGSDAHRLERNAKISRRKALRFDFRRRGGGGGGIL